MRFLQEHLLTLLIVGSLGLFTLASVTAVSLELSVLSAAAITIVLAHILERRMPFRKEWRSGAGDHKVDLISAGVLVGVADPLAKAVVPVLAAWLYSELALSGVLARLPLVAEIVAVTLVVELGKYWSHRLHHQVRPLWWLHAMHHSSERLYYLNGLRFHPLNYWVNYAIGMLPVLALGASPEAVFGYMAISQPVVLLQHANIDLRSGWLNAVFSTPEAHRWHHSIVPEEANKNFGNALLLWDHVFGTYKSADGFTEQRQVGLFAVSRDAYPGRASYLKQLLSMLRAPCCVAN